MNARLSYALSAYYYHCESTPQLITFAAEIRCCLPLYLELYILARCFELQGEERCANWQYFV